MKNTLALLFTAFSACAAFAAPANLIENPDFTAPDTQNGRFHGSWYGVATNRFKEHFYHKIDKTESVKGGQSLKLETDGPSIAATQFLKTLKPNTKYRFSFSIKLKDVQATQNGGGFFCQFNIGKKLNFPSPLLTGTAPWKKYTFEFTTPAKLSKNPFLDVRSWEAKGTAWFDEIELTEIEK